MQPEFTTLASHNLRTSQMAGSVPTYGPNKSGMDSAFFSLLEDLARQHMVLTLPHDGEQKYRFIEAMKARNTRIEQAGQEEYAHVCKRCQRVWPPEEGKPGRKWRYHSHLHIVRMLTII
jgi:hypothetical protein